MSMDESAAELERVARHIWPDDVQAPDQRQWMELSFSARLKALKRMRAIQGLRIPDEGGPRFETIADAAAAAEMGTSTFYAMLKKWDRQAGLAALGVGARQPANRVGRESRATAEDVLTRELQRDPQMGSQALVRALETAGQLTSKTTAMRLIREVRRRLPANGMFGRHVGIDSAGMDLFCRPSLPTQDLRNARLRLHAVLDVETALVLGWSIIPEGAGPNAYALAARKALATIDTFDLKAVRSSGVSNLEVRQPPDDRLGNLFLFGKWHSELRLLPLPTSVAERQVGGLIVRALGEDIAGISIGVGQRLDGRTYRNGREEMMPIISEGAVTDIRDWIKAHNRRQLERMPRDGSPEDLSSTLSSLRADLERLIGLVEGESESFGPAPIDFGDSLP